MTHKEKQNRNEQNNKHSLTTSSTNAKQKLTYYFANINPTGLRKKDKKAGARGHEKQKYIYMLVK